MSLNHASVKEMCGLIVFDDAKDAVYMFNPVIYRPELQILDTTRRSYYLDVLYASCLGVTIKLTNLCYAVIGKPLLQVCIEATAFKEEVAE